MIAHTLRAALAALALLMSPVLVQAQPQPQPQRVPAPDRHPGTGLNFPALVANVPKVRSVDYGKTLNRPELGFSWGYQSGHEFLATVYVYNVDIQRIPDGASGQPVAAQFEQALEEIHQAASARKYDQLKVVRGPANCTVGSFAFRCITMSALKHNRPLQTDLMLTGYRNHFLKLRLDWFEGSEFNQATVDRFVQTLVGTIAR
jgi:hypothetical protein